MAIPGDGSERETILEKLRDQGRRSGLVTTTYITHATPAGFGAHESSRDNNSQIAGDYLNQTRPDLLFGGGENGISTTAATLAGYSVATNCAELQNPMTRSTPARLYQDRSNRAISPAVGRHAM